MMAKRAPQGTGIAALEIRADVRPYRTSEPMWVRLTLRNLSRGPIEIEVSAPEADFDLDLKLGRHAVERTALGQKILKGGPGPKASTQEIGPSQAYECSLDLREVFVIDRPGTYALVAKRAVYEPRTQSLETVQSEPLSIEVLAQEQSANK